MIEQGGLGGRSQRTPDVGYAGAVHIGEAIEARYIVSPLPVALGTSVQDIVFSVYLMKKGSYIFKRI